MRQIFSIQWCKHEAYLIKTSEIEKYVCFLIWAYSFKLLLKPLSLTLALSKRNIVPMMFPEGGTWIKLTTL